VVQLSASANFLAKKLKLRFGRLVKVWGCGLWVAQTYFGYFYTKIKKTEVAQSSVCRTALPEPPSGTNLTVF
jgi:hypothetical protein